MKKFTILILLAILPIMAFGKTKLSLSEAVKRGLKNNYQVNISNKKYEIAKNNDSWGTAGRMPIVNIGASNINRYDNRESTFGTGRDKYATHQLSPYLQLSWKIFDGFSISTTKDNLETIRESVKADKDDVKENTIKEIIQAYYIVLLEKEKLEVFSELLKLSRDRYYAVELKKKLGSAVTFDLLQQKNSYLKDSSNYIGQEVFHRNAINYLNFLLNEQPDKEFVMTEEFTTNLKSYKIEELNKIMLENNTTLRNLKLSETILENNVSLANSLWYPSLSLSSGMDYNNGLIRPTGGDQNDFYSYDAYANLTLSFLLYNGGNRVRAVENSRVESEIGRLRTNEFVLSLVNRMKNMYDLYNLRKELYNVAVENKKAADLNLDIAGEKFDSGAINSFNYRDIQLVYLNASIDEINSIYYLIETETEILKLTGGLPNSTFAK